MRKEYYILLIFLITGCRYKDSQYQEFITKVFDYQTKIKISYTEDNVSIDSNIFNIKEYFSLFDKLKIDSLYKLEYHYFQWGDAGGPLLLALEKEENLDTILSKFIGILPPDLSPTEVKPGRYVSIDFLGYSDSILNPISKIKIEDCEMGYFQFIAFYLIGENFGLFSHANYGCTVLINSEKALYEILNTENDFIHFNREQKRQIKAINTLPLIELKNDSCFIEVLRFNAWKGFTRNKFSINRDYPHKIKSISEDILVKYDCGITF